MKIEIKSNTGNNIYFNINTACPIVPVESISKLQINEANSWYWYFRLVSQPENVHSRLELLF